MYRQGDVLLMPLARESLDFDPERATRVPRERWRVILAHGEGTGHAHAIRSFGATLYQQDHEHFLRLRWPATLRHEEHARIRLPRGLYRVIRQVEYPDVVVVD